VIKNQAVLPCAETVPCCSGPDGLRPDHNAQKSDGGKKPSANPIEPMTTWPRQPDQVAIQTTPEIAARGISTNIRDTTSGATASCINRAAVASDGYWPVRANWVGFAWRLRSASSRVTDPVADGLKASHPQNFRHVFVSYQQRAPRILNKIS